MSPLNSKGCRQEGNAQYVVLRRGGKRTDLRTGQEDPAEGNLPRT